MFSSSSVRDHVTAEVKWAFSFSSRQETTCMASAWLAPFSRRRSQESLVGDSEWAFHNFEISSVCVLFMSVLIKGDGTTLVRRGDNRPARLPGRGTVM